MIAMSIGGLTICPSSGFNLDGPPSDFDDVALAVGEDIAEKVQNFVLVRKAGLIEFS